MPTSVQAPKHEKKTSLLRSLKQRWRRTLGLFDARELPIAPPGRTLEVGCASGSYMLEATAQSWQTEGIEFSVESVARAQKLGLNVHCGTVENMPAPAAPFELVVGWMVFEHVHDPVAVFSKLRTWVQPQGWLSFSVPDSNAFDFWLFGGRWYALQVPGHITHFTATTAAKVLEKSGWKMTRDLAPESKQPLAQYSLLGT